METIIVTMVFESEKSLTNEQKKVLRELVEDCQYEIGQSLRMEEIEWSLERKKEDDE